MRYTVPIIFFLSLFASPVSGASGGRDSVRSSSGLFEIVTDDAVSALDDGGMILSAPLRFNETDWIITAGVIGFTASMFLVDEDVRTIMARQHGGVQDGVMDIARFYGSVPAALIISGGLYLGGLSTGDDDIRRTGLLALESVAITGLIVSALKSAAGRSRPELDEGPRRFRGFQFKAATTSLPSGHSAMAFAVSTLLAKRIDNPVVSTGLYGLAGLTAISRLYHDAHWFSDVVLGSAIGYFVASALAAREPNEGTGISWNLVPVPDGIGLIVRL